MRAIGFLILWSIVSPRLCLSSPTRLTIGAGRSQSLSLPNLGKAAVANGKVASARAVPPDTLVVTGLKPGLTTVRAWSAAGEETAIEIEVVAPHLASVDASDSGRGVVKVSLEFLELDKSHGRALGLKWPEMVQFAANAGLHGDFATSGLNYSAAFGSARGWLRAMVSEGWAKILAQPELHVRLGEEAVFQSGGEFPVPTTSENFGRVQRHVEWKPFGMSVRVHPQSADRLRIHSDIHIDISEVNAARAVEGIPALTRRHLETKMSSDDGETVVLSGLVRQASSRTKESLPLLSSIPLLGPLLFGSRNDESEDSEILMAVTFSLVTRSREKEQLERTRARWSVAEAP